MNMKEKLEKANKNIVEIIALHIRSIEAIIGENCPPEKLIGFEQCVIGNNCNRCKNKYLEKTYKELLKKYTV